MRKSLFFSLLLLLSGIVSAQGPTHSFIHISRKDGLASNDVYDIFQDEKGFYWVGTDNGLQRFDSKRWISPSSLPTKPVYAIMPAGNSKLLLKLGETYCLFDRTNFTFVPSSFKTGDALHPDNFLWRSSKGEIFLIEKGKRISSYNLQKNEFSNKEINIKLPAGWKPYDVFEDTVKGHYWLACDSGLAVYDPRSKSVYSRGANPRNLPLLDDPAHTNVITVYIDKQRNFWIVYGKGTGQVAAFSEEQGGYIEEASRLPEFYKGTFQIHQFYQTVEEEMWLFGKAALFNYAPEHKAFFNNKSDVTRSMGARFSVVRRIMQDREKGIWVATDEGIYQFYTVLPEVRNVYLQTINDDINISDVEELRDGRLWLSSRGKGIIGIDTSMKRMKMDYLFSAVPPREQFAVKHINAIYEHDNTGDIWLACNNGNILIADPSRKTSKWLQPEIFNGADITRIVADAAGKIWFGTSDGDVMCYDNQGKFRKVFNTKSPVTFLMIDNRQMMWISTANNGLFYYDIFRNTLRSHFRRNVQHEYSLSSDKVSSIVQLNDTLFGVATDVFNIININSKKIAEVSHEHGLLSNTITGMEKDKQGYVWIATSNGVCRYNPERKKFTVFGDKDGFMNLETIGYSGTMLANGDILFAGSNVFVTFPPHLYNRQEAPPSVRLTDLKVLNSFVPLDSAAFKNIAFDPNQNSISFYYSAMSYLLRDKLTYFYRLRGLDSKWREADNQMSAVYTLLPSGEYTFEVRCENQDGVSSPVTSFSFEINPPFWKTWWFIILVITSVALLLYFLHRLRIKRIVALAELRNRVARDLHDDVGSTLSTISILSTMAKGMLAQDPAQAGKYIAKIADNSQHMMDAMDDIVWSIKPMNDSMQKIVARMREFASGALEPKNIDVEFYVDEEVLDLKLNMESRRDLFLIFKEAVNNIAKYSDSDHVTIHIKYVQKRLMLKIKDNGIGFDINAADSGNGISNMKKRAAMLNGRIKWYSDKDRGTYVLLNVPVNA